MTKEDILESLKYLPCSNSCFEGEKNWKTGHCLENQKCEYVNGMWRFTENIYPDYTIVKCLDVDRKDSSQPEALLKNKLGEYLAIEMKCIPDPQFLESSVKKTDEKNSRDCSFWKGSIDDSAQKAQEKFIQIIKKSCPDVSQAELKAIIRIFFLGMNVSMSPIGKNLSVRDLVYQKRKDFKSFLENEMVTYSINLFMKVISGNIPQEEDLYKSVIFNNKVIVHFVKTTNDTVYFETYDTTPFPLRDFFKINEEGVTNFLKKHLYSCDKKFKTLNKETSTEKNILLLTHDSTLGEATNVIANCLEKLNVPESIHEIWVTDYHYESIYNDDGEEIGEQVTEYKYRQIYPL